MVKNIPLEYWDEGLKRFNSHAYFSTVNHHHVSDYSCETSCEVNIVECSDGRWYIEDYWGDVSNRIRVDDLFNPHEKTSYPTFFDSCESANKRAAEIVASITGCDPEDLMLKDD